MESLFPSLRSMPDVLTKRAPRLFEAEALELKLPPPHPSLRLCVVVPARNEEGCIEALLEALRQQRSLQGDTLGDACEVILLLNNCTDGTAHVARSFQRRVPGFALHVAEVQLNSNEAHVGRARQALFDTALLRFEQLSRPSGLILTTDADSVPAEDWVAQNEAEIAEGVAGVGGRIQLDPAEFEGLPALVKRFVLLDIGYRRALEEMRSLFAPEPHDPFPRHHQHFGGSLAVTAAAYRAAGGMPLRKTNEDVALYRAIVESGGKFRHSQLVKVTTSARMIGRAQGGLADALVWWNNQAIKHSPVLVESAAAAERRLGQLGIWCRANQGAPAPWHLAATPEPPAEGASAEIHDTICELRRCLEEMRKLSLDDRLLRVERSMYCPPPISAHLDS